MKRYIAIFLTLLMALILTGCPSEKDSETSSSAGDTSAITTEESNNKTPDDQLSSDKDQEVESEATSEEKTDTEDVEVIIPESPVETMKPEQSKEIELDENQEGSF